MIALKRIDKEFKSSNKEIRAFTDMLEGTSRYNNYNGSYRISWKQWTTLQDGTRAYKLTGGTWCNTSVDSLEEMLDDHIGNKDVYVHSNPTKNYTRKLENLYQLKFLYMDLDIEDAREKGKLDLTIEQVLVALECMVKDNIIPQSTMIVHSGRGLHLYWSIGDYVPNKINNTFWQSLQLQLFNRLKEYGADSSILTDRVRLLRVPTTINGKNGATCKIIEYNKSNVYTMLDIRNGYFKEEFDLELERIKVKYNKPTKPKPTKSKIVELDKVKNTFTLHQLRHKDLLTLINLRSGEMTGRRTQLLLNICYLYVVTHKRYKLEEVEKVAETTNELFTEPLPLKELESIVKSSIKYGSAKLEHDTELKKGNIEIDPNALPVGLCYRNETLITLFDITENEMEHMATLIDSEEKNKRKIVANKEKRRTEEVDGMKLTPKQKELLEQRKKASALVEQGFSVRAIAKELNISVGKAHKLLN